MRADNFLVENKYFSSRTKAQQAIKRGEVYINGKVLDKSSLEIDLVNPVISIIRDDFFVSLGGYKLKKALKDFNFDVTNLVVADVGASTGGFTDCLLQNGAIKVYAIDLNDELLDNKLKNCKNVVSIIKNAKDLSLKDFKDKLDLIVADLSFISESLIIPVLSNLLEENKYAIILIKPQFENDKKIKFKNGIIKDNSVWKKACQNIYECGLSNNLTPVNITTAPLSKEKNREFLVLFRKGNFVPCKIDESLFK